VRLVKGVVKTVARVGEPLAETRTSDARLAAAIPGTRNARAEQAAPGVVDPRAEDDDRVGELRVSVADGDQADSSAATESGEVNL